MSIFKPTSWADVAAQMIAGFFLMVLTAALLGFGLGWWVAQ